MISSMPRLRLSFSFTEISPVLGSVTAASPSCKPVRREVLSTSGTGAHDALDVGDHAIGLLQANCPAASRNRERSRLRPWPAADRCPDGV